MSLSWLMNSFATFQKLSKVVLSPGEFWNTVSKLNLWLHNLKQLKTQQQMLLKWCAFLCGLLTSSFRNVYYLRFLSDRLNSIIGLFFKRAFVSRRCCNRHHTWLTSPAFWSHEYSNQIARGLFDHIRVPCVGTVLFVYWWNLICSKVLLWLRHTQFRFIIIMINR